MATLVSDRDAQSLGFRLRTRRPLRSGALFFFLLSVCLALSCAHQMTPSGGPEDRTGPVVIGSAPAAGATGVRRSSRIVLTFTKWITPASAPKSVSILPPIKDGVKIHVSARRLEITPVKGFADSTTYHVVVTSELKDFHNNPMNSPFTMVFSTGSMLDSGRIAGCVTDPGHRYFQAIVGLYSERRASGADTIIFGNPDYLLQTDSGGLFSFGNIRSGRYRLIAFIDQNNNRRLDPGQEQAFAPLRRFMTVTQAPDTVMLYPAESDTAAPRLQAARAASPRTFMCTWTKPLDSLKGYSEPQWTIQPMGGKTVSPRIRSVVWLGARNRCALLLADTMALVSYRLVSCFSRRGEGGEIRLADTIRCNGTLTPDTVKPALVSHLPARPISISPEFRLVFSKPVTLTAPLALIDSLNGMVALQVKEGCSDTLILHAQKHLRPGMRYHLSLLKSSAMDLAGNHLKPRDTASDTAASMFFPVMDADSLAISLKGCARCLGNDAKRTWRFLPFSGEDPSRSRDSNGCFEFDSLPSGKGLVEYFTDGNNNGIPDPGSLIPWIPPEPVVIMPDTLEARPRWEVEGVTLSRPCSQCGPGAAPTTADTVAKRPTRR